MSVRVGVNLLFLVPGRVGGAEVYLRHLLPRLKTLDPDLELVLFTNRENHGTFPEYRRVLLPVRGQNLVHRVVAEQTTLVRAARKASLDLIFSPCYIGLSHPPCPQVLTLFDTNFLDCPGDFHRLILAVDRYLIRKGLEASRMVLTLTDFSRTRIVQGLGVAPEKVRVTPAAVSRRFGQPQPCGMKRPFLFYVANTYRHKNAARLVRAFASISSRIPHDLVILGRKHRGEPPCHPRVRRLRRVSFENLVGLYQACDLFVFPSWYEGFGLPVLEAMAAGARVAAARAAAIPEVAGEGATYFDPEDQAGIASTILEVLGEPPEKRARMLEQARAQAASFSWERWARLTLEAFTSCAESSSGRGAVSV
ncbi:MAG: glycosyltransferase family 4 protein [Acidobacteriota bacterium]